MKLKKNHKIEIDNLSLEDGVNVNVIVTKAENETVKKYELRGTPC